MAKNKKKNKKKKIVRTLTRGEKALYVILIALTIMVSLLSVLGFYYIQRNVIAADKALIVKDSTSVLWLLMPAMSVLIGALTFLLSRYESGIPLFRKEAKERKKPDIKIKKLVIALVAVWLLSWIPAVGSLYNRTEITPTHCNSYAMFGKLKESRPLSDVEAIGVSIYYGSSGKYSRSWQMSVKLFFPGGYEFRDRVGLQTFFRLDEYLPDVPLTVEGAENFDKLCQEYDLSEEEREKLAKVLSLQGND